MHVPNEVNIHMSRQGNYQAFYKGLTGVPVVKTIGKKRKQKRISKLNMNHLDVQASWSN